MKHTTKKPAKKKEDKIPKGYHRMPDGRLMKDSAHQNKKGY